MMKILPDDRACIAAALTQAALPAASQGPAVQFAALVGSRATGKARPDSDWDIALKWTPGDDWFERLGKAETLRHELAKALGTPPSFIDLIDLDSANLAMRASVANEGIALIGGESLAWFRFLQRTWRELEDFYWERHHAA